MVGKISWRFDDTFWSAWSSYFRLSDLPALDKSLHYETTMERPVVIWMRLHNGPAGHETQREQYLGPIPLKDAMAHLLREMVDTEADSQNCTHMCNGRLLAEHGFCMYKPLGRVKGQSSALVVKNLTSQTFKLQILILSWLVHSFSVLESWFADSTKLEPHSASCIDGGASKILLYIIIIAYYNDHQLAHIVCFFRQLSQLHPPWPAALFFWHMLFCSAIFFTFI